MQLNKTFPFIFMLIIMMCLQISSAGTGQTSTNLVDNGDFENVKNGVPVGWFDKNTGEISCQTEAGNHFIRLHTIQTGRMIMLYRSIPLTSEMKGLKFSFKVRYTNIVMGNQMWYDGRIIMNLKNAKNEELKAQIPTPYFRETKNHWETVSGKFLVPAGAVQLNLMPCLFMTVSGTIDFDDINISVMPDSEVNDMVSKSDAEEKKKVEDAAVIEHNLLLPPQTPKIKVSGNRIVTMGGKDVWLQGLSVDSMQWGPGENILRSIGVAIDTWKANVIRLPVHDDLWFGRPNKDNSPCDPEVYKKSIDQAIKITAGKGAWLVLDLHQFHAPMKEHVQFWKEAAERYKNNPAVIFEIFNEPEGISWKVWRDGGDLKAPENEHANKNPAENTGKPSSKYCVGMQALVDAVRQTGASNIIAAGGIDWSYDVSGVTNPEIALNDRGGNGIIYISHIYPWKSGWKENVLPAVAKFPLLITEVGCQTNPMPWQKTTENPETWAPDIIAFIQKYHLNWTAFSFHPNCGPSLLTDWYTPSPAWGVYVKAALAGKKYELKRMR